MRINSNISLPISNALARSAKMVARSLERLASGQRVNSPADDQAAYAMGVKLDSQIRGMTQGTRNLNDAMSILQTADSAIASQLQITQRIREIAVQASNSTLTSADRASLNNEVTQLMSEYNRISLETDFNGLKLIDGSFSTRSLQIGDSAQNRFEIGIQNLQSTSVFRKTVGTGSFQAATTAGTTGAQPVGLHHADLNGDGNEDLVWLNYLDATVTSMLGKGDGTFDLKHTISTPFSDTDGGYLTLDDFNNDGIKDVVLNGGGVSSLIVHLGNGDGSFKSAIANAAGSSTSEISTGDINGDGNVDLVVNNTGADNFIQIHYGNGNGTFKSAVTLAATGTGLAVKLADVDGNGSLDIVSSGISSLGVFLNQGFGNFNPRQDVSLAGDPRSIQIVDANGDGRLDIVSTVGTNLAVNLGNGNGTFGSVAYTALGSAASQVTMGDVNGDGVLDAIVKISGIGILLGNGNGTFGAVTSFATNGLVYESIAAADFNEDGALDISLANESNEDSISLFLAKTRIRAAGSDINVLTQTKSRELIKVADTAINRLISERATLSASLTRLEFSASHNASMIENLSSARSQMLDIDVAAEVSELTRVQILQQAQVASLGQANLNMQLVLGILGRK